LLGKIINAVLMFGAGVLPNLWYSPILASIGVMLIVVALFLRFTAWRVVALLLVGLLTAGEWWILLDFSRLPPYAGPVAAEKSFPEFTATRADGTPFARDSLVGGKDTVMVFFRGRW
jgi:hypothetical protein